MAEAAGDVCIRTKKASSRARLEFTAVKVDIVAGGNQRKTEGNGVFCTHKLGGRTKQQDKPPFRLGSENDHGPGG